MKQLLLLLICPFLYFTLQAQTTVYSEDFEGSLKVTTGGTPVWAVNTALQHGGLNSYGGVVATNDTSWFYTNSFSTLGNTYVILAFYQICKIEFFDAGIIEVSTDGGGSWSKLTETEYTGSGTFSALSGNKFTVVAYGTDWQASKNTATPTNSWWKGETFDISTYAGNQAQVQLRFKLYDGNSTGPNGNYGWLVDDIVVTASPSELIPPTITMQTPIIQGSIYGTGPFDIAADITDNTGIDTAYIVYTVNNGTADTLAMSLTSGTEYQGTIPSQNIGDTICYYLVAIDASAAANTTLEPNGSCYQFYLNNTMPLYCDTTPINSFVWLETFDSYKDSIEEGHWDNVDSGDDMDWTLFSGPTSSTNTGPDADHTTGSGQYIYLEASGFYNKTAYLISQCIDLTSLDNPTLEFWYHMYGNSIGDLHVDIYYANQWVSDIMTVLSGNKGNQWFKQEIDLSAYKNGIVQIRFRGSTGSSFDADMALDDISVYDKKDNDVYIYNILYPISTKCQLSATENITVVVKNLGINAQDTIPMAFQVNNGTIIRDTLFATLASSSLDTLTFSTTYNMSTAGTYSINAWTEMSSDQYLFNDTVYNFEAISGSGISVFPSTENFDAFIKGTPGTLYDDWTNETNDSHDWYVNSYTTSSSNTGPDEDHTTGNGMYMYLEANSHYNDTALLQSPCFDFGAMNSPMVEFYYHMYGSTMGSLHLDIIQNGIVHKDIMTPIVGDQGNEWFKMEVDLNSYKGSNIILQFRGIVGTSFYSDLAIDDITVRDREQDDVSVISIDAPFNPCGASSSDHVIVSVYNAGIDAETNIPVYFSVNNGTPVADLIQGTLKAGDTTSFIFSTSYNFSSINTYYISAWTALSADTNFVNDSVVNYEYSTLAATSSFPYTEDFDGFVKNSTTMYDDWTNESDDQMDWTAYSGATPTTLTGPDVDHTSGSGKYLYLESTSNYNKEADLTSPCFNIVSLPYATLEFWYHMYGSTMGELHVDIFYNGAWQYDVMTPIQGDQGNAWFKQQIDLTPFPGSMQIRFRGITGTSTYSDLAIDDIKIFERPKNDVGVLSIDVNSVGCDFSTTESISVTVVNYGGDGQVGIPLYYSINGGTPVSGNIVTYMNAGDTLSYTFTTTADLSTAGNYYLTAWTDLPSDTSNANDSVVDYLVSSFIPYAAFPFYETFESFSKSTPTVMKNGWYNDPDDDEEWRVHSGSSNTYTGPSFDHTTGAGKYVYVNSDSAYGSTAVNLLSPCVDISSLSSPSLGFWYHMYGYSMGSLYVDVLYNGVWKTNLVTLSGDYGDDWFFQKVDLTSYPGIIKVRFRGETGSSYYSDMALDDITVLPSLSVGIDSLYAQSKSYALPIEDSTEFNIKIVNSGRTSLTKLNVTLAIDGTPIATEAVSLSPSLSSIETKDYTFKTKYYLSAGLHDICVWTSSPNLSTDGFADDDTLCIQYTVFDSISTFPYCNNFDTSLNEWVPINAYNYKTGNTSWQSGTPNKTHITSAYSGNNAWVTGLSSDYLSLDSSGLFTPVFTINTSQCYKLSFYHNFYTDEYSDGGIVEYSYDGGNSWYTLGSAYEADWMNASYVSALDPNNPTPGWTGNSKGWIYAEHDYKSPSGTHVIFRFRFGSDVSLQYDGWAIDDFCMEEVSGGVCNFSEGIENTLKDRVLLFDAIPNPANNESAITFYLPSENEILLNVTNVMGEIVYSQSQKETEGTHSINMDVHNWSAGVYYYQLQVGKQMATKKLVVIK